MAFLGGGTGALLGLAWLRLPRQADAGHAGDRRLVLRRHQRTRLGQGACEVGRRSADQQHQVGACDGLAQRDGSGSGRGRNAGPRHLGAVLAAGGDDARIAERGDSAGDDGDAAAAHRAAFGLDQGEHARGLVACGLLAGDARLDHPAGQHRGEEGDAADHAGEGDQAAAEADAQTLGHHLDGDSQRQPSGRADVLGRHLRALRR